MLRGELVSSALIVTLLRRRMRSFGGRRLLLDGFPRSRENAVDFEAQCGRSPDSNRTCVVSVHRP